MVSGSLDKRIAAGAERADDDVPDGLGGNLRMLGKCFGISHHVLAVTK